MLHSPPSGNALAFAGHDSSVTVVYPSAPEQPPKAVVSVNTPLLPFSSLIWTSESEIVAAGYVGFPDIDVMIPTDFSNRTVKHTSFEEVNKGGNSRALWSPRVVLVSPTGERNPL